MQRRHLASATPSSAAGDIKIDDALDFPKKEEINDASTFFPHQEEINDTSALPRTKKINDASALLLYQAPSGIAVFSFDCGYLNDQDFCSDGAYRNGRVKDFWACLPPLTLRISMSYKEVPTPIDLVNGAIDERLCDRLIMLCGSGKKLVVGSVEYKRIIETDLKKITCLYVDAPDSEVIIHSLKNPMQSVKINLALAMLLYQAPSGIAIFCFDEGHLNAPVKDFWACLPQLNLIAFIKEEKMPIPIDLAEEVIDDRLAKKLRRLFRGSERKLVVGSAEYERIIGTKLVIKCLHRDVPDCEVIIYPLNKPMPPLSPEKQFEPGKDLELFLNQRGFDVKLEMLDKSMEEIAYLLHETESQEKNYLKFFRLLLKDFMRTSEIDAKSWVLLQFATALKMICYPGASYEVLPPDVIFSIGECQKIEAHASRYKRSFFKIDVLSVFEDVSRLERKKCILMVKLDMLIIMAKKVYAKADVRLSNDHFSGRLDRTDLCSGSEVGKAVSADVDGRLNSSAQDNCSDLDDGGKPATKTRTSPKEKRRTEDNTSTEGSDSSDDIPKNSDGDHETVETDDASKPATQTRTSPEKSRTGDVNSTEGSDSSDIQKDSDSDHETLETRDASKPATKTRTSPKEKRRTGDDNSIEESDSSDDIPKNSDGEIVETDDASKPATHAASRRLDSSPSTQKGEIPGRTSGRLKDLIASEMERERMETRSKEKVSLVSRIAKALGVKQRCMPLAWRWKSAEYPKHLD